MAHKTYDNARICRISYKRRKAQNLSRNRNSLSNKVYAKAMNKLKSATRSILLRKIITTVPSNISVIIHLHLGGKLFYWYHINADFAFIMDCDL
jgi:hypothetical protein